MDFKRNLTLEFHFAAATNARLSSYLCASVFICGSILFGLWPQINTDQKKPFCERTRPVA